MRKLVRGVALRIRHRRVWRIDHVNGSVMGYRLVETAVYHDRNGRLNWLDNGSADQEEGHHQGDEQPGPDNREPGTKPVEFY